MDMKILHLTLKKDPFDVMVTGEKTQEYREDSPWMRSRLFGKTYDAVKCVNGYGADKPYFIARYIGHGRLSFPERHKFSNGLVVQVPKGTFRITIGGIIETGNLKTAPSLPDNTGSDERM